jgi:hypothetical protein
VDALLRIVTAGGLELDTHERRPPVDPERAGQILVQVLGLAEVLPFRPRSQMAFPKLAERLDQRKVAA